MTIYFFHQPCTTQSVQDDGQNLHLAHSFSALNPKLFLNGCYYKTLEN